MGAGRAVTRNFAGGAQDGDLVALPSVACISFIPIALPPATPPGAHVYYSHPAEKSRRAFTRLFATGNQTPSDSLESTALLALMEQECAFRSVMLIDDYCLIVDGNGNAIGVRGVVKYSVGGTPLRVGALSSRMWNSPGGEFVLHCSSGTGELGPSAKKLPSVDQDGDGTWYVRSRLVFKIGNIGNLVGRFLTEHWAPSAYVEAEMIATLVGGVGNLSLTGIGTHIPSRRWYIRDIGSSCYTDIAQLSSDMTAASVARLDEFIQRGNCREASGSRSAAYLWTGGA